MPDHRDSPTYQKVIATALRSINTVNETVDDLLNVHRRARLPGPHQLNYPERVAHCVVGLSPLMTQRELAVMVAVLVERVIDKEQLDEGPPR